MKPFSLPDCSFDLHELTMIQLTGAAGRGVIYAWFRLDPTPRVIFQGDLEACRVNFDALSDMYRAVLREPMTMGPAHAHASGALTPKPSQ